MGERADSVFRDGDGTCRDPMSLSCFRTQGRKVPRIPRGRRRRGTVPRLWCVSGRPRTVFLDCQPPPSGHHFSTNCPTRPPEKYGGPRRPLLTHAGSRTTPCHRSDSPRTMWTFPTSPTRRLLSTSPLTLPRTQSESVLSPLPSGTVPEVTPGLGREKKVQRKGVEEGERGRSLSSV